jgi:hypothetical protein
MIKNIKISTIILVVLISYAIHLKQAEAIFLPFAGKVITAYAPPVVCSGEGPITIKPTGISPVGPYAVTAATQRYLFKTILPKSWVIGFYSPIMSPICWIPVPPPGAPVPVMAFPITMFGVSLPSMQ